MVNLRKIEEYAIEYDIPIICRDGFDLLKDFIINNKVISVLEIGSAIGYSAIKMALINEKINIVTIEKDYSRFSIGRLNIENFGLKKRIDILNIDAFDFKSNRKFDLIFIDGAKSQYIRWFDLFKVNLSENGIIVCDNLNFHGHVQNYDKIKSRNLRQLVSKIIKFRNFLNENDEFETKFYDIGDGMSISKRVKL
ncbi:MAG: O-methyltransferase [Bacilli bacterium]